MSALREINESYRSSVSLLPKGMNFARAARILARSLKSQVANCLRSYAPNASILKRLSGTARNCSAVSHKADIPSCTAHVRF